jgi:hypothetical protein
MNLVNLFFRCRGSYTHDLDKKQYYSGHIYHLITLSPIFVVLQPCFFLIFLFALVGTKVILSHTTP